MKRALILGYFGAGNFGDELILRSFVEAYGEIFKEKGFSAILTVKSAPEESTVKALAPYFESVEFVKVSPLLPYSVAVKNSTHLIAPGGSLLQNKTSSRSLLLYLSVIRNFEKAGKPIFLLNQGLGPIYGHFWLRAVRHSLSGVTFFSARDRKTARFVADLLPPEKTFLSSDVVFAAPQKLEPGFDQRKEYDFAFVLKAIVDSPLLSSPDFPPEGNILISAFQNVEWQNPRRVERLGRRFDAQSLPIAPPTEFVQRIGKCQVVFSERYHALVLSLLAQVPFVGVGDDPKIVGFCEECNMPYFTGTRVTLTDMKNLKELALSRFDRKAFADNIEDFSSRHEAQKKILSKLL